MKTYIHVHVPSKSTLLDC